MKSVKNLEICTERLRIRPYVASDLEACFNLMQNKDLFTYLDMDVMAWEDYQALFKWLIDCYETPYDENFKYSFNITLKNCGTHIGWCGLGGVEFDSSKKEIFYLIGREYWGQGYAKEAAKALLNYAFTVMALPEVVGLCNINNTASKRTLEGLGLKFQHMVDHLPQEHSYYNGMPFYALSREAYLTVPLTVPDTVTFLNHRYPGHLLEPAHCGASGAGLYHMKTPTDTLMVKVVCVMNPMESLKRDVAMLRWLEGKVPVPRVIAFDEITISGGEPYEILVMDHLEGADLKRVRGQRAPEDLVIAYAKALRALHDLDPNQCPVVSPLDQKLREAKERLEAGEVDPEDFEDQYRGTSGQDLYQRLIDTQPSTMDWVVCHGDYCLDNLIVNFDEGALGHLTGLIDLGRGGRQDRYQDLALAIRSIRKHLDPQYLPLFFEHYGHIPFDAIDWDKVTYYILLDEFF